MFIYIAVSSYFPRLESSQAFVLFWDPEYEHLIPALLVTDGFLRHLLDHVLPNF